MVPQMELEMKMEAFKRNCHPKWMRKCEMEMNGKQTSSKSPKLRPEQRKKKVRATEGGKKWKWKCEC